MTTRRLTLTLSLLISLPVAHAENKAYTFAQQAGSIAGAAQACGQDISEFTNRVNLAFSILANTTGDLNQATQAYQGYIQLASRKQSEGNTGLNCLQIIKDYNSLPIMQPDYETTVLQPMRQMENKPVTFLPAQEATPPQNVPTQLGVPNSIPDPSAGASKAPPVSTVPAMPGSIINSAPTPIQNNATPSSLPNVPSQFNNNPTPNNLVPAQNPASIGLSYTTPSGTQIQINNNGNTPSTLPTMPSMPGQ